MRTLGYLLLACVVLAALKAALAVLLVVLAIGLVWSAATRPRETAMLIGMLILTGLAHNHGLALLITGGFTALATAFCKTLAGKTGASVQRDQRRLPGR